MLGGSGLPPLDLPALLQLAVTALALALGLLFLLRTAASRYFVVDADFDVAEVSGLGDRVDRPAAMSIGGGGGDGGHGNCFVCGTPGSKKCSRCKSVQYCSLECQAQHWKEGHKLKCKELKSLDKSSMGAGCGRRKTLGFGSAIALVPYRGTCKVLERPKKILFPYDEFVKLFNWDKHNFPPCGLLNCGNSCFANVVLQCLSCTRPLIAYLLEGGHVRSCSRNDWCFLCELQIHVHKASQSLQPFSPMNILSRLPKIGGNLGYGRQEDAHEFMRFAIDTMQSVCLDEFGGEKALDASTQETTLIQHIFGGQLQSQVICTKCHLVSNRYERLMDLTVEIQGDAESLEDCLDQFTVKEWLDGENMYKCDGCNEYVKAWKRLTVHQPPNILTVALKRFQSGRFGKLNKRVTFPETLNLCPYMSGAGDGTDLYTLYAVVVHVDMLNASFFGHYICYTKDFHGNWYRIDDCKVMKVDSEEVLSQGAYMLLYRRMSVRQPFIGPGEPTGKKEEPMQVAPELLGSSESTSTMDNRLEKELSIKQAQREPVDMDLDKAFNVNVNQVGQDSGGGDFDIPVECGRKPVTQNPVCVDMCVSEPSSLGAKDPKERSDFQSDTDCPFEKVRASISGSDEVCHQSGEASFSASVPSFSSELECSSTSVPTLDQIAVDGPSDSADRVISPSAVSIVMKNKEAKDLAPDGANYSDMEGSKLHFSPGHLVDNSIDEEETTEMENGGVGFPHSNNRKLLNDSDSSSSRGNLEALSSVGFLDDPSQKKPSKELTGTEGSQVCLFPKNALDEERRNGVECMDNRNSNGLFDESNKSSRGNLKPLFSPGFLDNHSQKKPSKELTQTEGSQVCLSPKNPLDEEKRNGVERMDNRSSNGLFDESNKSSRGDLKPFFSPGFPDNHSQKSSPEEKIETENGRVDPLILSCQHPGDKEEGTQNGNIGDDPPNRYNSVSGLLYEPEKQGPRRNSRPLFCAGFLDSQSQQKSPKGKIQTENSTVKNVVAKEEIAQVENGRDGFHCQVNTNCNGLTYESGKLSNRENVNPLLAPGFLEDHHLQNKSLREKKEMTSSGVYLSCQENGKCNGHQDNALVQLNDIDHNANMQSLLANKKDGPSDFVLLLSRGFLNNSYRKSQLDNGNAMEVQKECRSPNKINDKLCPK